MLAAVVKERGKLEVTDVPIRSPNNDELLVKVRKASICYRDLLQLEGYYPRMKYPVILGHEMVGEVVKAGSMTNFTPGDRVVSLLYAPDMTCDKCKLGFENYCRNKLGYSEELDGFFSEYATISAKSAVRVPTNLTDELAVITPCVTAMIYRGVKRSSPNVKDSTVLVTGAAGGVGIHAVQLLKALGARVIAQVRSEEKARVVKRFSDLVVVGEKYAEQIKKEDVTLIVDTVGVQTFFENVKAISAGGSILQVGNLDPSSSAPIRFGSLILKDIKFVGNASVTSADVRETMELEASGKITPIIGEEVPLANVKEGLNSLHEPSRVGKILVTP
ncbi:alcohol dehydrogenase [Sulfolobales archaeon HS-7]|nr:alcohol dehydrogenase [Sulfolobales archaeon HS-7]